MTALGSLVYAFNHASNMQPLMLGILVMIEGTSCRCRDIVLVVQFKLPDDMEKHQGWPTP